MLKGMNIPLHDRLVTLSLHVKSKKISQQRIHTKNTTLHGSKKAHTQMHSANEADEE